MNPAPDGDEAPDPGAGVAVGRAGHHRACSRWPSASPSGPPSSATWRASSPPASPRNRRDRLGRAGAAVVALAPVRAIRRLASPRRRDRRCRRRRRDRHPAPRGAAVRAGASSGPSTTASGFYETGRPRRRTERRLPDQPRGRAAVRRRRGPGARRAGGRAGRARPVRGGRGRRRPGHPVPRGAGGRAGLRLGAALRAGRAVGGPAAPARRTAAARGPGARLRARSTPTPRRRRRAPRRADLRQPGRAAPGRRARRWCWPTSCSTTCPSAWPSAATASWREVRVDLAVGADGSERLVERLGAARRRAGGRPRPPGARRRRRRPGPAAGRRPATGCARRSTVAGPRGRVVVIDYAATTADLAARPRPSGCAPTGPTPAAAARSTTSAARTSPARWRSTSWPWSAPPPRTTQPGRVAAQPRHRRRWWPRPGRRGPSGPTSATWPRSPPAAGSPRPRPCSTRPGSARSASSSGRDAGARSADDAGRSPARRRARRA